MDFSKTHKYMKSYINENGILHWDICVYYNRFNVFHENKCVKPLSKNVY